MPYLWAGVATAWCLYSYNAGQLVPPLVFGWLVLGAVVRPARLRTHWRGAALLAAGFALTVFPYLYYFTDAFSFGPNWDQWTIMARNRQTLSQVVDAWNAVGVGAAWDILSRQIWTTWLGFGVLPGAGYDARLPPRRHARRRLGGAVRARARRWRSAGVRPRRDGFVLVLVAGHGRRRRHRHRRSAVVRAHGRPAAGASPSSPRYRSIGCCSTRRATAGARIAAAARRRRCSGRRRRGTTTGRTSSTSPPCTADPMSELRALLADALPADQRAALLGAEHFLQFRGELFIIEFPDARTRTSPSRRTSCPCTSR